MNSTYGTLRSPWMFIEWVLGLCAVLLGMSALLTVGFSEGASVIVPCLVPGCWLSLVVPFAGVRVNENGLKYRGVVKFWSVPWADIRVARTVVMSEGHVLTSVAPVVETVDGRERELTLLAGYSGTGKDYNQRVVSQVGQLENLLRRVV